MYNFKSYTTEFSETELRNLVIDSLNNNEYGHTVYNKTSTILFDKSCWGGFVATVLSDRGILLATVSVEQDDY